MFRKLHVMCAIVALTVGALLPSPASAQTEKKFYNAFAYFYHEDFDNCVYYETYLDVFERWSRSASGPTVHSTTIDFFSLTYDTCQDVAVSVVTGSVPIPANAFHSQGLRSASLQTVANFTDRAGGAIVPVSFDLTWTCLSEAGGNHSLGSCAPVDLSGSVLVGSRNLMDSSYVQGELLARKDTGHDSSH